MMSWMSGLGRPRRSTTIFWKPGAAAQVALPLPLDARCGPIEIARAVALVLLGAQLVGRDLVHEAEHVRGERAHADTTRAAPRTILTPGKSSARLDRPPWPRARCPRRAARGAPLARASAARRGGLDALPHVDGLVAVHAQQRPQAREALGGQLPRRHVEVVRGPHRREHPPLAVADLPAHGRQKLGAHDAVGGDAVEAVALDDLQIEEPPRDRQKHRPSRAARRTARAGASLAARRLVRRFPWGSRCSELICADAVAKRAGPRDRPTRERALSILPSMRRKRPSTNGPTMPVSSASMGAWRRPP